VSAPRQTRASEGAVRNRNPVRSVASRVLLTAVMSWLLLHSPADLGAQQARTLVHGEASNGGFGAIVFKGSAVNDQFAGFFGARGAWITDHVFALGVGGYVMGGGVDVERPAGERSLTMWYGGAEIEFISGWSQVYHITFLTLIGGGSLGLEGESDGYRFIWDVDIPELSNGDLSQFFGQVSLKFGAF